MIERLERISAEMFKNALRTYTAKDVLIHKRAHAGNVPEMLSLFPNKGVGFRVMKKHWKEGKYYEIKRAVYKVRPVAFSRTATASSTATSSGRMRPKTNTRTASTGSASGVCGSSTWASSRSTPLTTASPTPARTTRPSTRPEELANP